MKMVITEVANVYRMPSELFAADEWGSCSVYSGALGGCARRVNAQNRARLQEPLQLVASGNKVDARHVGTIFHLLAEYYHSQRLTDVVFRLADKPVQDAADHAVRLFKAYRKLVPTPEYLGEVLATELTLPRTAEERDRIHELLGVAPFKGTLDLILRVDEAAVERWARLGLEVLTGVYILDFKTHTKRNRTQEDYFLHSLQRMAYTYLGRELFAEWGQVRGMIGCHLIWTKEPQISWQLAHVCDRHEEKILKYSLQFAKELLEKDLANPTACVSQYGACPFLVDGSCSRC